MMRDKIHIVLAANGRYKPGLELTRASLLAFAKDPSRIVFHEFTEWPDELSLPRDLSLAYIRLFLPELLPHEDFVIWSDVDILWRKDVGELWDRRKPDKLIMAVHDCSAETFMSEARWMRKHGYSFSREKYFCSGMMVMNLKRMREVQLSSRCREFISRYDDVLFADQSVLNALYADDIDYIGNEWNMFSRNATRDDFFNREVVIHYAGETPWIFDDLLTMLTDTRIEWFRMYAELVKKNSLYSALRTELGWLEIVLRRILFLMSSNDFTRLFIWILLVITGRARVIDSMRIWARRI